MVFDDFIKNIKKYKKNAINSLCYSTYNKKIDENLIYIESMNGDDFSSNMLRIVEELSSADYDYFKIVIYAKKDIIPHLNELKKNYNLRIDKIVSSDIIATRIAETAKFIITDSKIRFRYVKKDNQIIINIYHENPIKKMGIDIDNNYKIANLQHPFLLSDYILIPNEFTYEKIFKSLLIDNTYSGKILKEGNPRNNVFFRNDNIKSKLNLDNYQIYSYMPCYWGLNLHQKFVKKLKKNLKKLDKELNDNQIIFLKIDGCNKHLINLSKFKHIKEFPIGYDTYDIINISDMLITDYSSVCLDFINTNHKIILFNFDDGKYGLFNSNYFYELNVPFIEVNSVNELIDELNSKVTLDYSNLISKYCPYDNINSSNNICQHIFLNNKLCKEESFLNDNPNVLIYAGGLTNEQIIPSLTNLLNKVDTNKFNFFVTFPQWGKHVPKQYSNFINQLSEDIRIIPMRSKITSTLIEKIRYNMFMNSNSSCNGTIRKMFNREFKKQFYNFSFDYVLNLEIIHKNEVLLFCNNDAKSSIWVHNDINKEIENDRLNENIIKEAFNHYHNVVVDSSELFQPLISRVNNPDKINTVHNMVNLEYIDKNSKKKLELGKDTKIYTNNPSSIKGVLNNSSKKIITMSRNLYIEEWSENLLNAFDEFCEEYDNVELIIVGDVGSINKVKRLVFKLKNWSKITIIKKMPNVLPVLKECDLFMLSPSYRLYNEYLFKSSVLQIPVASADDIPIEILKKYDAYTFENSYDGIFRALNDFMDGKINTLDIDYNEFNEISVDEFYKLLE